VTTAAPGPAPSPASPLAAPAIRTTGLTKRFGSILAVDRLDLEIPSGSIFGLLGPNGAGKTTTIRLIVGLARPDDGRASVGGLDVARDPVEIRRRVGVLDQDPRFYGWMTGRELLLLAGRLVGVEKGSLRGRVDETLRLVGLAEAADRRIDGYSGGMRQRLGIGQALVGRPGLLILDEPVSSLDPEGRRDLLALIGRLQDTATVLLSTHVLSDVERVCDRVAILDHGRLVTEGPIDELLDRYALPIYRLEPEPGQGPAVAALAERLRTQPWVTGVDLDAGALRITVSDSVRAGRDILPAVVAAQVSLIAFERLRPTLEDVFVRLVGRNRGDGPIALATDGGPASREEPGS
jgi:ABC-2 type transport system ATP-binding protein